MESAVLVVGAVATLLAAISPIFLKLLDRRDARLSKTDSTPKRSTDALGDLVAALRERDADNDRLEEELRKCQETLNGRA